MSIKISPQTSQQVTSSGSQSIDDLLGGGYTVGSLNCICASPSLTYAEVLVKYYISQGLASDNGRCLVLQSAYDDSVNNNLSNLVFEPVKTDAEQKTSSNDDSSSKMKIAWRYENLPRINESPAAARTFDKPSAQQIGRSGSSFRPGALRSRMQNMTIDGPPSQSDSSQVYCNSFNMQKCVNAVVLNNYLESGRLQVHRSDGDLKQMLHVIRQFIDSTPADQHCRIAIQGFGSAIYSESSFSESLYFLVALKQLLRSSHKVICLISQLSANCSQLQKHIYDTVFSLTTHSSTDQSYFAKEFTGILTVEKLPRINRVCVPRMIVQGMPVGNAFRFGFKCRKRKFALHKLCLPPEIGEDTAGGNSCSSSGHHDKEHVSRNQGASISLAKKSSSIPRPNVTDW